MTIFKKILAFSAAALVLTAACSCEKKAENTDGEMTDSMENTEQNEQNDINADVTESENEETPDAIPETDEEKEQEKEEIPPVTERREIKNAKKVWSMSCRYLRNNSPARIFKVLFSAFVICIIPFMG
jgi:uncharacterized lipoprotein